MAELREYNLFKAKLFSQALRYDEMVEPMKKVVMIDADLTVEERNLLSLAYKNVVGARRTSWRIVSAIEQNEGNDSESHIEFINTYRKQIEKELRDHCLDILEILDKHVIPSASTAESKVFYLNMKGDYLRYFAETESGNKRREAADNSWTAYKAAYDIAETELSPIHPIRLGLALNFSVLYYEILNLPECACSLAKTSFDDAIAQIDNLSEEDYEESTLIMQLIRDNLTVWTSDIKDDEDVEETDLGTRSESETEEQSTDDEI